MNISVGSTFSNQTTLRITPKSIMPAVFCGICWTEAILLAFGALIPLSAFLKTPALRTGFNYFLISFLFVNLLYSIFLLFLGWDMYFDGWLINAGLCAVYSSLVFLAGILTGWIQVLITANRMWALFFPHHYRTHHSKRSSAISCVTVWLAVGVIMVSYCVLLYNKLKDHHRGRCFGKQIVLLPGYTGVIWVILVISPILILFVYPFLLRKYVTIRRVQANLVLQNRNVSSKNTSNNAGANSSVNLQGQPAAKPKVGLRGKIKFLVLTWVVVCIIFFWSPILFYGVIQNLRGIRLGDDFIRSALIFDWMLICQCVEPWIFVLAVPQLRLAVKQLFRCASWI